MAYTSLFIVTLLIPYPSVQHFIWPLHWCLLADICNHTYIPECGTENEEDVYNRRLFIDECDLYEYNCDFETDYYPINYSSCFNMPPRACPPAPPCPSIPPCPDHRYHNIVDHNIVGHINVSRKMYVKRFTYVPTSRKKRRTRKEKRKTTQLAKRSTARKTIVKTGPTRTKILKRMTVKINGRVFIKVLKKIRNVNK